MEEWTKGFLDVMSKHADTIRENTQALNEIKLEARLQTVALQAHQKALDEVKFNINSQVVEAISGTETKIDNLDKDMKIQWAILGGGFLSVIATIVVAIMQIGQN